MSTLSELFSLYKDQKFILVEPGGNWGDYLIYLGAQKLCNKLGILWERKTKIDFLKYKPNANEIIYIHGGGGFNTWCSDGAFASMQHAVINHKGIVIYGPCTSSVELEQLDLRFGQYLSEVNCKDFYIFAREVVTYEAFNGIKSITDKAVVMQDFDTAFHLTAKDIEKIVGPCEAKYNFFAYRSDNETSFGADYDLLERVVFDPAQYCSSFKHWLLVHSYAQSVVSNRTHSVILSSILGKPVTMFGGSYHKNKSIWEYSLKAKGVGWISSEEAQNLLPKKNLLLNALPNKVLNSYKVNKMILSFKGVPFV